MRLSQAPVRFRWAATLLLGAAGLLLNLTLTVSVTPGTDLLFGSIPALLAAVAFGPAAGFVAAAIASARTVWLWNHPWAWLIFSLEASAVGYLVARWHRRPLTAMALYWLFVGMPLLVTSYGLLLGISGVTARILFLKQPLNAFVNVLVVEALLLLPMMRRALGITEAARLRTAFAVIVTIAAVVPTLAVGIWDGQQKWESQTRRAAERARNSAQSYAAQLEQYVSLHEQAVRSLAESQSRSGALDAVELQRLLTAEHEHFPGFANLYAADARGVTVAFQPATGPGGRSLIGLDFSDRPYYREVQRGDTTVVTDVFGGRGGLDEPLVAIVHPITVADTFAGFVLGALDLKQLPPPVPATEAGDRLRVVDAAGMVVFDSRRQYRSGDRPRSVGDTLALAAVRASGARTITYQAHSATAPAAVTASRVLAGTAPLPALGGWVWVEHPFANIQAAVVPAYVRLLAVILAVVIASLFLSTLLARWFAVPLLRVREAARRLAAGDLGARAGTLPANAPVEVAQMGRGFDEMAAALERYTAELEQMGEIARSLTSMLDPDELLRQITNAATRLVDADGCGMALLQSGGETLRASEHSTGLLAPVAGHELPLDASLAGWAVRTGESVLVDDVALESRLYAASIEPGRIGSVICAPLVGRSGPLGALLAVRGRSRAVAFTAADLRLLERLAGHAAIAVENARLLEAAHAGSRAKSEFLATISHELRTPLNGMLGHLQILEMGVYGPLSPGQHDTLTRIGSATRHLRGLIEEVLAFSRLEAGRVPVRLGEADLRELVDEVAAVIEPLAWEKRLGFHVELPAAPQLVRSDADKIRQILINLAGNAVKFTDAGEVRLRLSTDAARDEARLTVADTGPGIAAADFGRLFDPFVQLDAGLSRAHGGTGLGLYLSQKYADLIGARIEVESEPGRGSTFTLMLPCTPRPTAPAQSPAAAPATATHR